MQNEPFEIVGGPTPNFGESQGNVPPVSAIEQLLADGEPQPQEGDAGQAGEIVEQFGESNEPIADVTVPLDTESQDPGLDSDKFTVTVDGEDEEVTLEELQAGYRRHASYTRNTQQLAEERRTFEAESQQSQKEREQYKYLVTALGQRLEKMNGEEPDWQKIAAEDPAGYVQQKAAWDQRQTQLKATEQESTRLQEEDAQKQQDGYLQYMQHQRNSLLVARPELSEPEKAQTFFGGINNYAKKTFGFTDQEIGSVTDHRFLLMAEKAMKFDQLQADGQSVATKVKQRPPLKPGVSKRDPSAAVTAARKAQARLERSGSTRDAADMIETMLD